MINYNLLNEKLYTYLEGVSIDDLKFIKSLNDIILRNAFSKKILDYKEKIDLNYSASLAYTFFKYLSDDYASYFEKRLNDGTINFSYNYEIGHSYYDNTNERRIIEVPITNTIEDSFVMVHETLHDMNLKPKCISESRMLYSETISMLGEILFEEFLVNHKLHMSDSKRQIHNIFASVSVMALCSDFDLKLISDFINNDGYVDITFFKNLCTKYDSDVLDETLLSLSNNSYLSLNINQRYIIGCLFACYMHDRIKSNPKYLCEFIETNEMMQDVYFESLMNYLDLSIEDNDEHLIFTNDSLKNLEKCYKKEIKNR